MTDSDIIEMKQKIAEYEKLGKEVSNYSSLIFSLTNVESAASVMIGVYDKRHEFRMDKPQLDKLIHLLADFREETDKKMEEM